MALSPSQRGRKLLQEENYWGLCVFMVMKEHSATVWLIDELLVVVVNSTVVLTIELFGTEE